MWTNKYVSENVLKQSISELRNGLNDVDKSIIKTVPKIGYVLRGNVEPVDGDNADNPRLSATGSTEKNSFDDGNQQKTTVHMTLNSTQEKTNTLPKQPEKNKLVNLLLATVGLLAVLTLWMGYQIYQTKTEQRLLSVQHKANAGGYEVFKEVLFEYHRRSGVSVKPLQPLIDNALKYSEELSDSDPLKLGELQALSDLYQHSGNLQQAHIIAKRADRLIKSLFKESSAMFLESQFHLMDIVIALRLRQEAYDIAQRIIPIVEQYHAENNQLTADAWLQVSRAYLYCVEPLCERAKAMETGERFARLSLTMYETLKDNSSERIADAQSLINWFLFDGTEKKQLLKSALATYQKELGDFHPKTVAAMEEYGRIIAFYDGQWQQTEQLLRRALHIRKTLHQQGHPKIGTTYSYLAEHYFMSGNFAKALEHMQTAMQFTLDNLGEGNDKYLEHLMLLARIYLYSGESELASRTLASAFDIERKYKLTPSSVISRALNTTRQRLVGHRTTYPDSENILSQLGTLTGTYKAPASVIRHEYHSQLLRYYPNLLPLDYLANLEQLLADFTPNSRYLYEVDIAFVKARATDDCIKIRASFCEQIARLFEEKALTP